MTTHLYRGRSVTSEEIAFIRQLITDRPELSRWKLSRQLCEAWQWKQANGALRDMVCRGLLLMLDRAGEIELPPVKREVRNRLAERERPEPVIPDNRPMRGPLHSITPLEIGAACAGKVAVRVTTLTFLRQQSCGFLHSSAHLEECVQEENA